MAAIEQAEQTETGAAPATAAPAGGAGAPAIEVHDLVKRFGDFAAVDDISFAVEGGEVFAFLGPNGAGKSTTISMLCTLLAPTSGRISVAGHDVVTEPKEVRRRIGLVFQESTLDDQLTAEENLRFHAVLYRVPSEEVEARIDRVLALVDLSDRRKDLVSEFSGGMARRLEIARALLHVPRVLFLDEPTVGLDPQTRALMWEDVLRLRDEAGITVFLTTHYMDEAEYADRIAIIDHGRIVALDSPAALKAAIGADAVDLRTADDEAAATALRAHGYRLEIGEDGIEVFVANGEDEVPALIEAVGVPVSHVHVHRPTLDDVFLHYTGREIREEGGGERPSAMMRARMGGRR
ncbi:MAG TPA: ATP-binding cassette domain-containing protein [Solirubrobacterales bacterium]|nr:ATP-binding cassette domain-containing protein [Solirubrobacterales bacterium]